MSDEITPVMWQLMEEAATTYHFAGMDLRYEGGPFIDLLNQLASRGYLDYDEDEKYGYSVRYAITETGRLALDEYRRANHIPFPPDDLAIMDFDWLAYLVKGEYTRIEKTNTDRHFAVESLSRLAASGYVEARSDEDTHYFALSHKGKQAHAEQHFRLHGKFPNP